MFSILFYVTIYNVCLFVFFILLINTYCIYRLLREIKFIRGYTSYYTHMQLF